MKWTWTHPDRRLSARVKDACQAADAARVILYLVGGGVRDAVLRRPCGDVDLVLEGEALAFVRRWAPSGAQVKAYPRFGTVTVSWPDGQRIDFAGAREEVYPRPGALPVVRPGPLSRDLYRRDFTINAMALALNGPQAGVVMDPCGGLQDLKARKIRILHPASFRDDPTRILRAVRYEQRFGFHLESETLRCLKIALADGFVAKVKPPRWLEALRLVLQEEDPGACLERMRRLGVPVLADAQDDAAPALLSRICRRLQDDQRIGKDIRTLVSFMVLFETVPEGGIPAFARRYGLTRVETQALRGLKAAQETLRSLNRKGLPPSAVYRLLSGCPPEIISFIRARSSANIVPYYIDRFRENQGLRPCLTGRDLEHLGVPSGAALGHCLDELLARKLDGELKTRADERRVVKEMTARGCALGGGGKDGPDGPHQ